MKYEKFNQDWKFWENNNAFALIWDIPVEARSVALPHDAMILEDAYEKSANSNNTGFRDGGTYIYVKTINPAREDQNKCLKIKFEGIYSNAFIYVNGQLAAKNHFGYSTFYVELNDYLNFGEKNEIRVIVRNGMMTNSRWYTGSGIYRDTYWLESHLTHIEPEGVQVSTKQLNEQFAQLEIQTKVVNRLHKKARLVLKSEVYCGDLLCASETSPITVMSNNVSTVRQAIGIERPKPWSAESPTLYRLESKIYADGELLDSEETLFGIRTISVDATYGLRVNDEQVKLRGACIHHDSGILGAATYYDYQYRQIQKLKEAGFNAVRMAHQPMAPAMLKCCDELGMYVMDEAFDMWVRNKSDHDYSMFFTEHWQDDVLAMVRKDYNHPSVIMYSIGNEIPEIGTDHGAKVASDLSEFIKRHDPTRFTLASINGVFATGDKVDQIVHEVSSELVEEGVLDGHVNHFLQLMESHMDRIVVHDVISEMLEKATVSTDIAGYNYMAERYVSDKERYPNRVILGSETYPPAIGREWPIIKNNNNVIGDFTWTGWDYIGEAGVGIPAYEFGEGGFGAKYPSQLAYCSDINLIGIRRPASYFREIVYGLRNDPYIVVQNPEKYDQKLTKTPWVISDAIPSWSYPEHIDKPVIIEVYSPGEQLELRLNGESVGLNQLREQDYCKTTFEIPYQPGELEAITYKNGVEIGRDRLVTCQQVNQIQVDVDYGNSKELVFVEISILDDQDNLMIMESDLLNISVEGTGKLLGLGSGDPKPLLNYSETKTNIFQGRALAILQLDKSLKQTSIHLAYRGLTRTIEV